ncbi:MAG TPA: hypothetical protein VEU94_10955 [Terriglobales bacterium]|nr:hypothetical protein [Terriglobales bacterium]
MLTAWPEVWRSAKVLCYCAGRRQQRVGFCWCSTLLVPCVVFFFAVSPKSAAQQLRLFELPVIFWRFGPLLSL